MKPVNQFQKNLHGNIVKRLDWHYDEVLQPETDDGDVLVHIHIGNSLGVKWSCRRRYVDYDQVIPLYLSCRSIGRLVGYKHHVSIVTHYLKHHNEYYEIFVTYVV